MKLNKIQHILDNFIKILSQEIEFPPYYYYGGKNGR